MAKARVLSPDRKYSEGDMQTIRNILLAILALLLQSTVAEHVTLFGFRPDMAMIAIVFIAESTGFVPCILFGFAIGFFQDVYSPEYLGYNALTMSVLAYILAFIRERLTTENFSVRLLMIFIACLLHDLIYLSMYAGFDFAVMFNIYVWNSIVSAAYTSVLAMIIISLRRWLKSGGLHFAVNEIVGYRR